MNNERYISFNEILSTLIQKALEDGVITPDEQDLIDAIKLDIEDIDKTIKEELRKELTKQALSKVISNASRQLINKTISIARKDARISSDEKIIIEQLITELGWTPEEWKNRKWFVFKICIRIDKFTDISELLSCFDSSFCIPGIDNSSIFPGLCLGTKHYVIDDQDVTLLAYALDAENKSEWVTKGAFAIISFTDKNRFILRLRRLAQDLLADFYLKKSNM